MRGNVALFWDEGFEGQGEGAVSVGVRSQEARVGTRACFAVPLDSHYQLLINS